ncbi:J domain-containing protein [Sphingomonas sp.]|uniref:J domain-containing protein n=1 Tax=Sphingomonas sp. TaxID=28214 RepID=UPI0035C82534
MGEHDTDLYATLGVSPRADSAALALAYRAMLHRHHPDKGVEPSVERTIAVVRAYAVLRHDEERARYDRTRLLRWSARRRDEPSPLLLASDRDEVPLGRVPVRAYASAGLIALFALVLCLGTAFALIVLQHVETSAVETNAGHYSGLNGERATGP